MGKKLNRLAKIVAAVGVTAAVTWNVSSCNNRSKFQSRDLLTSYEIFGSAKENKLDYAALGIYFDNDPEKTDIIVIYDTRTTVDIKGKPISYDETPLQKELFIHLVRNGIAPVKTYITEEAKRRLDSDRNLRNKLAKYLPRAHDWIVVPSSSETEKAMQEFTLEKLLTENHERVYIFSEPMIIETQRHFIPDKKND